MCRSNGSIVRVHTDRHTDGQTHETENTMIRLFQLEILFLIAGRLGFCMIFKEKKPKIVFKSGTFIDRSTTNH